MRRVRVIACALAFAAVAAEPALAETVVRWVSAAGVVTWEPTHNDNPTSNGLAQVYEGLTQTDADLPLHPALATEWAMVRPDTWRFRLRPDVRFHDGAPLTAADVVFSLDRTRGEGSDNAVYLTEIAGVAAPAEDVVEIATKAPDLLLPVKLRRMPILSRAWAERHGAERPARSGDASAYTFAHEDGTGPFVLESFEPGRRAVLVKNPAWWGAAAYPHGIDRIVWTTEPDPGRRLALLLDGEADFLQDPPPDGLDQLRGRPGSGWSG